MEWEMIGTIVEILGVFIALIATIIALIPYMRKYDLHFSFDQNVDRKPVFVITNNSQKGQF